MHILGKLFSFPRLMHFNKSYQQKEEETNKRTCKAGEGRPRVLFTIQTFFLVLWINESIYQNSSQSRENTGEKKKSKATPSPTLSSVKATYFLWHGIAGCRTISHFFEKTSKHLLMQMVPIWAKSNSVILWGINVMYFFN